MLVLGIETSCDETAAALVEETGDAARPWRLRSSVVASQADIHREWGGVVPELSARQHVRDICGVVERALDEGGCPAFDAIAVTQGPGLVGSLLVGVSFAKSLAWARDVPIVPVHHLAGHIESLVLEGGEMPPLPGADAAFPVEHRGELLGALAVSMPPADPIDEPKAKLVADLAAQAGLVLRNVRLTGELQARLEDLRAAQKRLVAAQDEARRRLERKGHLTSLGHNEATVAENRVDRIPADSLPGPATLMSRLVRSELERQQKGGWLARFVNQAWVLSTLLALCLGTIAWAFWPPSEEYLFTHGSALMDNSTHISDWERAWREYFEPLNGLASPLLKATRFNRLHERFSWYAGRLVSRTWTDRSLAPPSYLDDGMHWKSGWARMRLDLSSWWHRRSEPPTR